MKIVGAPVCGWKLVERPPMSQRSHIAISGSTAICACSVACSAPSSSSSGTVRRAARGVELEPQRLRREAASAAGRARRGRAARGRTGAGAGRRAPCRSRSTSPKESVTPSVSRRSSRRTISVSVSRLGCVYQSPVERRDQRAPALEVELAHLVGAAQVQVDGALVHRRVGARAPRSCRAARPRRRRRSRKLSGEAERSETSAAG